MTNLKRVYLGGILLRGDESKKSPGAISDRGRGGGGVKPDYSVAGADFASSASMLSLMRP